MSYMKRSPCQKYYDKSTKDGIQKSMSATRFVPFRRTSDTTSDSGSEVDFKIEPEPDLSSSFSRSSSESCHSFSAINSRYQCILKDLNEVNSLDKQLLEPSIMDTNENLDDFKSRLNMRRKIKTRKVIAYQDDDKTDNSCDSTTLKAHEEILRNANLLKQGEAERSDASYSSKKIYHQEVQCSYNKKYNKQEHDETILMNEFDKILQIQDDEDDNEDEKTKKSNPFGESSSSSYQTGPSTGITTSGKSIARSLTENFVAKSNSSKTPKCTNSPRFRRKTHSQVLKAASSIPSLIFSNKSMKFQKTSSNINYGEPNNSVNKPIQALPKNSIDDEFCSIGGYKARRSPLRFLGNFVDDKIFRGRWGSTKRAKSTDEITWALANEDLIENEIQLLKESNRSRKKSLGLLSNNSTSSNNDDPHDKNGNNNNSELPCKKLYGDSYPNNQKEMAQQKKMAELKKRKSSNTSSDMLSISGLSNASFNEQQYHSANHQTYHPMPPTSNTEIRAETLAEIEAFEELLKKHLQN